MNYGFVVDNRKCIGCHACSTACKSENEVPLGVSRTWVKTVEYGAYPNVARSFQVTRCNHCANPPCVRICPVGAMFQRNNGIVEFAKDICIGCKACMQACPYDAIHIDPETNTAAKCHMCSQRVDIGLEPACVVVCPEHAIVFGDMDDPTSEISQTLRQHHTTVRKPEQGTAPKLFYIDGDDVVLHPTVVAGRPQSFQTTDVVTEQGGSPRRLPIIGNNGAPQGVPPRGPIHIGGGTVAEQMVQVAYNAQHEIPWHWPVPAYLVTKGIGAGIMLILALGFGLGLFAFDATAMIIGGLVALVALAATTGLLVYDLEKPSMFLTILTRPQWRSWLTRGAFVLVAFSVVAGGWWAFESAAAMGWIGASPWVRAGLGWLTVPLAVGAAIYTAFLFAQAEGRDLWQSPLLPIHLVVQSLYLGAGSLLLVSTLATLSTDLVSVAQTTFAAGLIVDLFITLVGEFGIPHASEVAARAAHEITGGRYKKMFWWGVIGLGHVAPLALVWIGGAAALAIGVLAAIVGLYLYEHAFVMAPQEVPNS